MAAFAHFRCLAAMALSMTAWLPAGYAYETHLQDGTRLQVDPRTNRATALDSRGNATQLWDGVHRLEDGSIITIRSGVMVPNKGLLESQRPVAPSEVTEINPDIACSELVGKVCGIGKECEASQPCSAARQLLDLDTQEHADVRHRAPVLATAAKCQEALRDPGFFAPCKPPPGH
jgi:hypothetical protein